MEERILSTYSAKQVDNVGENILFEADKADISADEYFTGIIGKLRQERSILQNSLSYIRSGSYTEELLECDAIFDKDFICFKNFVESNKYMREEEKRAAATTIWEIISANDLNMYRLGYEEQMASANAMFAEFDKPQNATLISLLTGVSESLILAKESNANLMETYRKSKGTKAETESKVAASFQKRKVRDIINEELMPYISIMAKVNPDTYAELYQVIGTYIEDSNTKARARSTRNANDESVSETQE